MELQCFGGPWDGRYYQLPEHVDALDVVAYDQPREVQRVGETDTLRGPVVVYHRYLRDSLGIRLRYVGRRPLL